MRQVADDHGGDQHAQGSQQANGPAIAAQITEVDVQGAGKQQERQHPVHEQVVEIDLVHQPFDAFFQAREADKAQPLQQQGKQQRRDHHADSGGQADETVVHIGQKCGEADKRGN